jgi:hypothetical protein
MKAIISKAELPIQTKLNVTLLSVAVIQNNSRPLLPYLNVFEILTRFNLSKARQSQMDMNDKISFRNNLILPIIDKS